MGFRVKAGYFVVAAIVAVVALYLIARPLLSGRKAPSQSDAAPAATAPPLVQVAFAPQYDHPYSVSLRGRTQAIRAVVVRSETAGLVVRTPVLQGTPVAAGQVLCQLAVDARAANLDLARATLRAKQLQMQASSTLAEKGFRAKTQVLTDQADLDSASAGVRQAEVALRQINIVAPFAGVFDHRDAEIGTYLAPGQSCGSVIELDPILVVGDVPETDVGKIHIGAPASAKLVSGETVTGRVRFVAHDADASTRTYRIEITVPNRTARTRSGLSADVSVGVGDGPAHLVPDSALVLDAGGRQGVRYVEADGRAAFAPVTVLEHTPAGVWIAGLSGPTRVITVGQSYVADGQRVRVAETTGAGKGLGG